MHDIDVLQRIVEYFLMHEQQQQQQQKIRKGNVSKLLDNYLAEVARDPNLSVTKFQVLAELLPENTRTCDDGLYRAIDIFLKVFLASSSPYYYYYYFFLMVVGLVKAIFKNLKHDLVSRLILHYLSMTGKGYAEQ